MHLPAGSTVIGHGCQQHMVQASRKTVLPLCKASCRGQNVEKNYLFLFQLLRVSCIRFRMDSKVTLEWRRTKTRWPFLPVFISIKDKLAVEPPNESLHLEHMVHFVSSKPLFLVVVEPCMMTLTSLLAGISLTNKKTDCSRLRHRLCALQACAIGGKVWIVDIRGEIDRQNSFEM